MADFNVQDWLEHWVDKNVVEPGYRVGKAAERADAKACADEAKAAGITMADLKEAAGGDLETYLLHRQNALTDAEVKRLSQKGD